MKNKFLSILALATIGFFYSPVLAQTSPNTFVKGDLNIRFETRQKSGVENVTDKYNLNINVNNSTIFKGLIESRPQINGTFGVNQTAQLSYDVDTDIVNPNNPAQTRNVGKVLGVVPVTENNIYQYSNGSAKINVFGMGAARGFESKFGGQALGKPPVKSGFEALKQDAMKLVNGKGASISITKYDKMEFQNINLPAGPVAIYPEVQINGVLLFDYIRSAWYFQNIIVTYAQDGKRMQDNITGNIRWVKDTYIFDVKVNEPALSETAVFAATADESAFFATDDVNPSLTGSMKYKDTMSGDRVIASNVSVDLIGNKLTKQQTMYLVKMLFLVSVVPFNAE